MTSRDLVSTHGWTSLQTCEAQQMNHSCMKKTVIIFSALCSTSTSTLQFSLLLGDCLNVQSLWTCFSSVFDSDPVDLLMTPIPLLVTSNLDRDQLERQFSRLVTQLVSWDALMSQNSCSFLRFLSFAAFNQDVDAVLQLKLQVELWNSLGEKMLYSHSTATITATRGHESFRAEMPNYFILGRIIIIIIIHF